MADQAINALSTKTAPETSDQLLLVDTGEPQLIDYDKLADAILNKITSKNYALDAGQMTLLAALNKLNSDLSKNLNGTTWYNGNNTSIFDILSPREGAGVYSIYSAADFPTTEGYGFIIKGCERMIFIDAKGLYYAAANRGEWIRSWSKL